MKSIVYLVGDEKIKIGHLPIKILSLSFYNNFLQTNKLKICLENINLSFSC